MKDTNYLFYNYDLRNRLDKQELRMNEEIDGIEANRLLNTSVEDLVSYFVDNYKVEVPRLLEDKITVDPPHETKVDARDYFDRHVSDPSKPFYIPATKITFYVPFEGDSNLFLCQSSMMTMNPPHAAVEENTLIMQLTITNHDGQAVKKEFDATLSNIKQLLIGTGNDVGIYNNGLKQKAENRIKTRREKLLKDQGIVAELGYPLRKRENAPTTYTIPIVRKKIVPQIPLVGATPFKPEPTLEWSKYEDILSIISNMVTVIEYSPSAFLHIDEEDLRQHFLVQLNGQYAGQATGETFNAHGKTDILIRADGKNIFIAECKFWKGKEYLIEAIGQLLSYTSWRDTKTSILIFNRNKNLSDVLKQIPIIFKERPNFKRQMEYKSETGFRFVLHHNDDPNREIFVTVLVFEMPI